MTQRKQGIYGYGFSLEGLVAARHELETDRPARGPTCPLTADLMDLALGQAEAADARRLRDHLADCPGCQVRFASQERAVQQLQEQTSQAPPSKLRAEVLGELRDRQRLRLRGAVTTIARLAADGGPNTIKQVVTLMPVTDGTCGAAMHAVLEWNRSAAGSAGGQIPGPWSVTLSLPLRSSAEHHEREHANAETDLNALAGRPVRLKLLTSNPLESYHLETQLHWDPDHTELISHPETVAVKDPGCIASADCVPNKPIERLDVS
jgi:hypothetical protein